MIFFILIIFIVIIYYLICYYFFEIKYENTKNKKEIYKQKEEIGNQAYTRTQETYYPYHKKYLLTQNEYYFYKKLKNITEPLNLQILAKIRLADLIEVNRGLNPSDWGRYFGKIKAKHIDFAIADDMKIVLIIELDDRTHQHQDRIRRDMFVDDALSQTGYTIIRTYGDIENIKSFLESRKIRA